MNDKIHALLIGDITDAPYHPLEPAKQQLEDILGAEFELTGTEDYNAFGELEQGRYPLCISYTDCWKRLLTVRQKAGLMRYVAGGGGLLTIHNGISLQGSYELLQLLGARFTQHPPYQPLHYYPVRQGDNHPLLEGVEDFALEEEPYMFELDPHTPRNVFLEYEYEGQRYPAGWEHAYGLGRVVYLQPGHHAPSFLPEAYRRLLLNSARWAAASTASPD